jgi:hypothetical protein
MQLRLKYPPTPEFAMQHADLCVQSARDVSGVVLDYSVESLELLDDIIESFRESGVTAGQVAETLFTFGCYVGEVFVRNSNGKWRKAEETSFGQYASFPMIVQLGLDNFVNPIGKVFKRFKNGKEDYLPYFYHVFTSKMAENFESTVPSGKKWWQFWKK